MAKNDLRRVPIVDRNGKRTTVLKKTISDAFDRGETDLERTRRKRLLDTPFPSQLRAADAARAATPQIIKGLIEFDVPALAAGGIGMSTAAVYLMRELRNVGWEGNTDLSRHFLARLADVDFFHPIDGYKRAKEPATIYRGKIDVRGLAVLGDKHDRLEADARGANSLGEHRAAELYERVNNRLVQLVFEDDPAAKADEIAKELREQKFSDRTGFELLKMGWMPYGFIYHTPDTQDYRDAHKKASLRMEQTAAALRSKKWP